MTRFALALLFFGSAYGANSLGEDERVGHPGKSYDQDQPAMKVDLWVPASVRLGEPVPMTLSVRNTAAKAVHLGLTGRPTAFDLEVSRADETIVWNRLHEAAVSMILEFRRIEPGTTLAFADTWDQRDNEDSAVSPGTYYVRGILPAEQGDLVSETHELVIVP
jgi:hypothetical protein